ncbi:MAG: class I SAM-dependent methyltransferase [Pseudomonadota bacterium]
MTDVLASFLVCPRCQGTLAVAEPGVRCARCEVTFPVYNGIPRMTDGAEERDERMAAEWRAQAHARPQYTDQASVMNRWEEQVLPQLVSRLGDVQGPILDVGCGVGHLGNALTAMGRNDIDLFGIDFQRDLLDEAHAGYAGLVEADVHHLPIRSDTFGAAIASNSLHHFPDPERAMVEIARVLRPGGVLVAYDPRFVTPLEKLKKVLRRNDRAFTEEHKAFRIDEYRELLGSSGLTVIEVRTVDPVGPLVATGLDYLRFGRLGVAGLVAKSLVTVDGLFAGAGGQTPLGLMLAGRAVKPPTPPAGRQ